MLKTKEKVFNSFYNNQIDLFKAICQSYLNGLEDEHIRNIYRNLPGNLFTDNKNEFFDKLQHVKNDYISQLGREKLKKLWTEKTNSESPRNWSEKNRTPLLCMVPDGEENYAKEVFGILIKTNPDNLEVEKAAKFISEAEFMEELNYKDKQNDCMLRKMSKQYAVLFDDVDEIRNYLHDYISMDVYDWYPNIVVENKLHEFAEKKYKNGTNKIAIEKIENMESDKLKKYLINLVRDNVNVGIEIINDK